MTSHEAWLQITAGQGPAECVWAVLRVLEKLLEEAASHGIDCKVLEIEPGPRPDSAQSVLLGLSGGESLKDFVAAWQGTVQWTARSPFRPEHKRKNWFVGIAALEPVEPSRFSAKDVSFETMRASGPGGQHVNRRESAVRVTHLPTGLQASASEERSQHRNRKLALARLVQKLAAEDSRHAGEAEKQRWRAHHKLQRGNPRRIFR